MPSVDAELRWGDERLSLTSHALGARFDPGGPFGQLEPLRVEREDVWLVVPPRARAWVKTANGWRDLVTLRVLGGVTPDPDVPGAARVRLRRLRDVQGLLEGVVLVRVVDACLELEGFTLRVSLGEPVGSATRLDRRALRTTLAFAAFTATLLAGVLSAFGAVPARTSSLDLTRLETSRMPRLPPVRVLPPDRTSRRVETKHEVEPRAAGGRVLGDVMAPPRAAPSRRAAGRRGVRGRGERRAGAEGFARLTAAVTAMQTLGIDEGARRRERAGRRAPLGLEDWMQLATMRGSCGTLDQTIQTPTLAGPTSSGWGRGRGVTRLRPPRPARARVTALSGFRIVPHCERRYLCHGNRTCHPCVDAAPMQTPREAIRRVVRSHLDEVRFCYEAGRALQPTMSGRVTLRWQIAADGSVTASTVTEDGLGDPMTTACLRAAPEGWRFPTSVGVATVSYPFVFRAQ